MSLLNPHDDPETVRLMGCDVEVGEPRFTAAGGVVYRDGKALSDQVARALLAVLADDPWSRAPELARELTEALANAALQRARAA